MNGRLLKINFIGERNVSRNGESEQKHKLLFNYMSSANNNFVVYTYCVMIILLCFIQPLVNASMVPTLIIVPNKGCKCIFEYA